MSLLRLDPPIPLLTEKGSGQAHIVIDYGLDQDLLWVIFLDNTGECYTFRNSKVRSVVNATMGNTQERKFNHE